jgi:hypothetical protein
LKPVRDVYYNVIGYDKINVMEEEEK